MPLDMEAGFCLSFCDESCQKDNRCSLQFSVGLDLRRYFAPVFHRHHYVEQDQIRSEIPRTLMSLGGIVLFEHKIAAGPFEEDLHQTSTVAVIIDNQDASLLSHCRVAN